MGVASVAVTVHRSVTWSGPMRTSFGRQVDVGPLLERGRERLAHGAEPTASGAPACRWKTLSGVCSAMIASRSCRSTPRRSGRAGGQVGGGVAGHEAPLFRIDTYSLYLHTGGMLLTGDRVSSHLRSSDPPALPHDPLAVSMKTGRYRTYQSPGGRRGAWILSTTPFYLVPLSVRVAARGAVRSSRQKKGKGAQMTRSKVFAFALALAASRSRPRPPPMPGRRRPRRRSSRWATASLRERPAGGTATASTSSAPGTGPTAPRAAPSGSSAPTTRRACTEARTATDATAPTSRRSRARRSR